MRQLPKAASSGEVRPRSDLQHLGHRRAGQDEAPLEVVHTRHGRDHLRRGLERQGEVGGGQVGVAADQQVVREAKIKAGKYKKKMIQVDRATGCACAGPRQQAGPPHCCGPAWP